MTLSLPRATYRLQLYRGFTFKDATEIVPYLAALGISHVYCSPYLRARPGSTHGYDVVDHNAFNPEIGSREDFERFVATLRAHDMGHLLDFVPNHVGIMGADNVAWMDVLENGSHSPYADYFDIDWQPADPALTGKVLAPVLGDAYGAVLERGELQLRHEPETDSYAVYYREHRFPINRRDHSMARAVLAQPTADALHELLEKQAYRLAHWRVASDEVNYRRFFDINDLAALRMENEAVFDATHRLVFELLGADKVQGLRIDHPDGLYDPAEYFERLQRRYAASIGKSARPRRRGLLYVLAEKIMAHYERLPELWPIAGSTGYDFANLVNGLFVDRSRRVRLDRAYRNFTGEERSWNEIVVEARHLILRTSLAAEVTVLANQLHRIARADRLTRDFSLNALRQVIRDVIANFPVYRTYVTRTASDEDERYIHWAISRAKTQNQAVEAAAFDFLQKVLLPGADESMRMFAMKFQQVTAPAAAKGVEDTAFYRFSRLLSLNEVGADPEAFGTSVGGFHRENRRRQRNWPQTLLASSTHDTKRAEDVRARLNVLSEVPGVWRATLKRFERLNRSRRTLVQEQRAPGAEDEYQLYQTLLGSWPLQRPAGEALSQYSERIVQYVVKAAREAKLRTSWANVNEAYEQALTDFVNAILDPQTGSLFLEDLHAEAQRIAAVGLLNSLSQTALKLACPGVPDIYQGNELWDFSLVDPDNRRPVDFRLRQQLLAELQNWNLADPESLEGRLAQLWATPADGRAKLYLTWRLLSLRRQRSGLFHRSRYLALQTTGEHGAHLCAFARTAGANTMIVIAPRLLTRLLPDEPPFTPASIDWGQTYVVLKPNLDVQGLTNIFDGQGVELHSVAERRTLSVGSLLRRFPVAVVA